MRAVAQPRRGKGGRYEHLLPQVGDGSARRRTQGIDGSQEAPGAWDIRLLQPGHHVELAFQEAGISRKAPHALLTPALRLALLVEIVGCEEESAEDIRRVAEIRVFLVRATRRQRGALQIFGLVVEAAERGQRA